VLTDVLAEVPDDEQDALLRPRGFWHREKVRLRRPPDAPPPRPALDPRIRPVRREDAEALVVLYARAYRERTGEFWIAEAADPDADARENVGTFFDGAGGWAPSFLPAASHVCEEDGRVVGAILVEARDDGAAYVADVMVDPERQRRGIGRRLVERALAEVTRAGPRAVELAAYRFGAPYRLYRSLGFEDLPRPEGRLDGQWVRGPDPLRAVAGSREP
jgi:GNAT superfamily N-acetyltransferase